MEGKEIMNINEVARYLAACTKTVRRMIDAGKLPAARLCGDGALRIRKADVDALFIARPRGAQ